LAKVKLSRHFQFAEDRMSRDFQVIQLDIDPDLFRQLPIRLRNTTSVMANCTMMPTAFRCGACSRS
jgi:hypothetical protein